MDMNFRFNNVLSFVITWLMHDYKFDITIIIIDIIMNG